jgi:hypothetical protein
MIIYDWCTYYSSRRYKIPLFQLPSRGIIKYYTQKHGRQQQQFRQLHGKFTLLTLHALSTTGWSAPFFQSYLFHLLQYTKQKQSSVVPPAAGRQVGSSEDKHIVRTYITLYNAPSPSAIILIKQHIKLCSSQDKQ